MNPIRVIFVGVHYKPGMAALDSRTRTGMVIDRIIAKIKSSEPDTVIVKSNLYDLTEFPKERTKDTDIEWVNHWKLRVNYTPDDIIVTLGTTTNDVFRWAKVPSIKVGHPGGLWSTESKRNYVKRTYTLIGEEYAARVSTDERSGDYLRKHGYDPDELVKEGVKVINDLIAKHKKP